jgi:hypothetical protein
MIWSLCHLFDLNIVLFDKFLPKSQFFSKTFIEFIRG